MSDMRNYAKKTNRRLVIGFILILLIVGMGLVAIFWGTPAALFGAICLAGMIIPSALIWGVLTLFAYIRNKADAHDQKPIEDGLPPAHDGN